MEDESVIGDWIRQKVLGSGSFGTVSLWRNLKTDEKLAIKICKLVNDVLTAKHKERWSKEVEMMNFIQNANIVGTIKLPKELEAGLGPSNISKLPMLCMEYCSKGDLRQLLNHPENASGVPEPEVRSILSDMKCALSHLHQLKITHRDLKPENIVLQVDVNNKVTYKLIDLGYAKEIDSNSVCASFVGTLQYLAPELLYSKTYSNTVDYWSFGLVAFEAICGTRPFLPHMPPVQWMNLVKSKTSDNICVFENSKGEVEYSDMMFHENHISSCLKELTEKWLRIALEWDPKKRGRIGDDKCVKFALPEDLVLQNGASTPPSPRESSLVIFSLLESILSKKIIKLFSVSTYEYLSYEIDDSTMVGTVQGWVERDTGVAVPDQLLVSFSQSKVDKGSPAHLYWNTAYPVMLYVYHHERLFLDDKIQPKIPPRLRYCLENPKIKCKYSQLLEMYTSTLFFIKTEKQHYDSLVTALHRMVEHLKQHIRKLFVNQNESDKNMGKLSEKSALLSSILEANTKNLAKYQKNARLTTYVEHYNSWANKAESELEKNVKLRDAFTLITTRLQSVARRCNEIHEKKLYSQLNTTEYRDLQSQANRLVQQVKLVPKENRGSLAPCVEAVKLICKCLKARDKLLFNVEIQKMAQQIIDIHVETTKMSQLITSAGQNADELSADLTHFILEKEDIIFACLNSIATSNSPNNVPPSTMEEEDSQPYSVVNFKIGAAVSGPKPRGFSQDTEELHSLLKDNMSLRQTSRNIIRKSCEDHKNILQEMDFSFLEPM